MLIPFGNNLPLTQAPYYSRINDNYVGSSIKNYYMLGFNPGYALQASELNEMQELFFLNLNLTQRASSTWGANGFRFPFWDGAIPVDPNLLTITNTSILLDQTAAFTLSFDATKPSWFLWTDPTTKMSFWINYRLPTGKAFSLVPGQTKYIALTGSIDNADILCCQDGTCSGSTNQDPTLRDNSRGDTNQPNTCGASRKSVSITDVTIGDIATQTSTYYPIMSVTATNSEFTFRFLDGQTFKTISA